MTHLNHPKHRSGAPKWTDGGRLITARKNAAMHDLPGFGVWISGGVDEAGELLVRGLVLEKVIR